MTGAKAAAPSFASASAPESATEPTSKPAPARGPWFGPTLPAASEGAPSLDAGSTGRDGAAPVATGTHATHSGFGLDTAQEVVPTGGRRLQRECGPLPFLIQRDGTWLYQGTPIRRKPMVCLFASILRRDEAGRYRLETPVERGEIEVEDVPFVAVELEWRGQGRDQVLAFRTNVDEIVCAGPGNPLQLDWDCVRSGGDCAAIPYLTVRAGDGVHPIQARVARAVYYELVALAVEGRRHGEPCLGVWSQNRFFPIGPLADASADVLADASVEDPSEEEP